MLVLLLIVGAVVLMAASKKSPAELYKPVDILAGTDINIRSHPVTEAIPKTGEPDPLSQFNNDAMFKVTPLWDSQVGDQHDPVPVTEESPDVITEGEEQLKTDAKTTLEELSNLLGF